MLVFSVFALLHLLEQFLNGFFPSNPFLHRQPNDPLKLLQMAFSGQIVFLAHSSMS